MQNTDNFKSDTKEFNNSSTYITTFKILIIKEVIFINIKLANKTYTYLFTALKLTIKFTTEPYTKTDLFAYNIATTIIL